MRWRENALAMQDLTLSHCRGYKTSKRVSVGSQYSWSSTNRELALQTSTSKAEDSSFLLPLSPKPSSTDCDSGQVHWLLALSLPLSPYLRRSIEQPWRVPLPALPWLSGSQGPGRYWGPPQSPSGSYAGWNTPARSGISEDRGRR